MQAMYAREHAQSQVTQVYHTCQDLFQTITTRAMSPLTWQYHRGQPVAFLDQPQCMHQAGTQLPMVPMAANGAKCGKHRAYLTGQGILLRSLGPAFESWLLSF